MTVRVRISIRGIVVVVVEVEVIAIAIVIVAAAAVFVDYDEAAADDDDYDDYDVVGGDGSGEWRSCSTQGAYDYQVIHSQNIITFMLRAYLKLSPICPSW